MYIVYETENKYTKEFKGRVYGAFITREAAAKSVAECDWLTLAVLEADCVYEAQSYEPEWNWEEEPDWEHYTSATKFFFVSAENAETFAKQYKFWNVRKHEIQKEECGDYVKPIPTIDDIFGFLDE